MAEFRHKIHQNINCLNCRFSIVNQLLKDFGIWKHNS